MHKTSPPGETREQPLNALLERARRDGSFDYTRLRIVALPSSRGSIACFELGDPDGAPLLCLHGLSLSGYYFEQFHAYFVANGIRAIAPCLLGGICLPDPRKTIQDLTGELIELLDVLGIDRFDVIGFSWGTLAELALLARVPQRIRRAGFLGPMLPSRFLPARDLERMKADVRLSLRMAGRVPALHRGLMWLVCRLPVAALMNQFRDDELSGAEARALAPGSAFAGHLSRSIEECIRTGSAFFTDGWRMFLDEPGYALGDLASVASRVQVRLYVAERDNVHLPSNAAMLAAACTGTVAGEPEPVGSSARPEDAGRGTEIFQRVYTRDRCSIWARGAGRMACILHLEAALDNLLSPGRHADAGSDRAAG